MFCIVDSLFFSLKAVLLCSADKLIVARRLNRSIFVLGGVYYD